MLVFTVLPPVGLTFVSPGCSWYEANMLGGCLRPSARADCSAPAPRSKRNAFSRARLAVIIPYRGQPSASKRESFQALCERLPKHLHGSGIRHHLLAINQVDNHPFNRAALANVGYRVMASGGRRAGLRPDDTRRFDYLAVHDVDRMPVAAGTNTSCNAPISQYYAFPARAPRVLHPNSYTGGVLVIQTELFERVNGFSNKFWGWGHEDNELYLRLRWCGLRPEQAPAVDWCMEHHDCAQCQRAKELHRAEHSNLVSASTADQTLTGLRAETRLIALLRERITHPERFMHSDGLTVTNFSAASRPQRFTCGNRTLHVLDVRLHRDRDDESGCAVDGSARDDGCISSIDPQTLPGALLAVAKSGLPRDVRFSHVVGATRGRAMYNYHYELDVQTEVLRSAGRHRLVAVDTNPAKASTLDSARHALYRIAICFQEWQRRGAPDTTRYQLLWRAKRMNDKHALASEDTMFHLTREFKYAGHFPCTLHRPPPTASVTHSRNHSSKEAGAGVTAKED